MKDAISITRTIVSCAVAVLLLLAAPGIVSAGQLSGDTTPKLSGAALVKELQKGGHVIYFRHGTTAESGEKDVADADLDDCARQRNLSDAGQTQTKEIGAAFKVLRIPVGEVYNSPYCRCVDTARNLFGKGAKNKALHFAIQVRSAERASITTQLLGPARHGAAAGNQYGPGLAHRELAGGRRALAQAGGRGARLQAARGRDLHVRGRDAAGGLGGRGKTVARWRTGLPGLAPGPLSDMQVTTQHERRRLSMRCHTVSATALFLGMLAVAGCDSGSLAGHAAERPTTSAPAASVKTAPAASVKTAAASEEDGDRSQGRRPRPTSSATTCPQARAARDHAGLDSRR